MGEYADMALEEQELDTMFSSVRRKLSWRRRALEKLRHHNRLQPSVSRR
jgi:hypothetical protein